MSPQAANRLRRLAEELEESGLLAQGSRAFQRMLLEEIDLALRPPVHERRVPSTGTLLDPQTDSESWCSRTQLEISRTPVVQGPIGAARRFVDGLSSWLLRRSGGHDDEWLLFDRPAGSERDLVVLADVTGATIVQRHPTGAVRIVGEFGVMRWDGITWHHEPPLARWIETLTAGAFDGKREVVEAILRFAVHDLGSMGIGALLIYRSDDGPGPPIEQRLPTPPMLGIRTTSHLAPLRHALAQVDGAAVFDPEGILRNLGVRLVPSATAEKAVPSFGGMRHTSGLRYSHDDPLATVIAVSEDGPVSVLQKGAVLSLTS